MPLLNGSSKKLKLSTLSLIEKTESRHLKSWLCSCNFRALLFLKLTQMARAWHWIIFWVQHMALSSTGRVKTRAQDIFISLVITSGFLAGPYHCSWAGFAWATMECLICLAISLFFWLVYPFHQMYSENIYFTVLFFFSLNLTERDVSLISILGSFCVDMDLPAPGSLRVPGMPFNHLVEHQSLEGPILFNLI